MEYVKDAKQFAKITAESDKDFVKQFAKITAESVSSFYECVRHFRPCFDRVSHTLLHPRLHLGNNFGFTLYALGLNPLGYPVSVDSTVMSQVLDRCIQYDEGETQGGIVTFRDIVDHNLAYSAFFILKDRKLKKYNRDNVVLSHFSDEYGGMLSMGGSLTDFLRENDDLNPKSLEFFGVDKDNFLIPRCLIR